jgi:serine/threonine protein kinase
MEAFSIAKQLFSGLAQAHKAGALHLDLRPDNIMIDKEGTAKIMDLGIARLFRAKGIIRAVAGMPQYMSPEQLEGQEADARSDIFAAGAIVYEMLTGTTGGKALNLGSEPYSRSSACCPMHRTSERKRYLMAQEVELSSSHRDDRQSGFTEAPVQPTICSSGFSGYTPLPRLPERHLASEPRKRRGRGELSCCRAKPYSPP